MDNNLLKLHTYSTFRVHLMLAIHDCSERFQLPVARQDRFMEGVPSSSVLDANL
jgi:hypothetical protein